MLVSKVISETMKEAAKKYADALTLDPSKAVYYTNRAHAYLKLRKFKSCVEDCNKALELDPRTWKAYLRRADARYLQGNFADAILDYKQAAVVKGKNTDEVEQRIFEVQAEMKEKEMEVAIR